MHERLEAGFARQGNVDKARPGRVALRSTAAVKASSRPIRRRFNGWKSRLDLTHGALAAGVTYINLSTASIRLQRLPQRNALLLLLSVPYAFSDAAEQPEVVDARQALRMTGGVGEGKRSRGPMVAVAAADRPHCSLRSASGHFETQSM